MPVRPNGGVGRKGHLHDLTREIDTGNLGRCVPEQPLLDIETHQPVMGILALHQRREVNAVVCHQHTSIFDRAPHQCPVLPGSEPEPG